jgi:hypothetical protein
MPAESSRFRHRIGRRDRWFLGFMGLATLAGVVAAAVVLVLHDPASNGPVQCVKVIRAGFMGGQTETHCGASAVEFCRRNAPGDSSLAAQCARLDVRRPGG